MTRLAGGRGSASATINHTVHAVCTSCPYGRKETLAVERLEHGYRFTIFNSGGDFMAALNLDPAAMQEFLTEATEYVAQLDG